MQKCPLCDKKIQAGANFCSQCGWDLTDRELTPPQMAKIQEEIVNAGFGYMRGQIAMAQFNTVALVFIILSLLASFEVIAVRATWVVLSIAAGFSFVSAAFGFLAQRYNNKQDRLKIMLRDRQPSQ